MDDINNLGQDNNNTLIADKICQAFELVSGYILIHNRKTMLLGLGSWVGHHGWLPPWLQEVDQANVYGVLVTPIFVATIAATVAAYWDLVAAGVERVLLPPPHPVSEGKSFGVLCPLQGMASGPDPAHACCLC
jgi:hypothetical protein